MTDKTKIILIYAATFLISASVVAVSFSIRRSYAEKSQVEMQQRLIRDAHAPRQEVLWQISADLEGKNQDGETIRVSSLEDKVWIAAQFYAVCPQCAQRNGDHLLKLYRKYASNPDFQVVCFSVDPKQDTVEHLRELAKALEVDSKNWWFVTGDEEELHQFMENGMGFAKVRKRIDQQEIAAFGPYSHDLSVAVIDRGLLMRAKRDLLGLREQGEDVYKQGLENITSAIERSLADQYSKKHVSN